MRSAVQRRHHFIQLVLDEIREVQDVEEFYHNSFYVIAKLGLLPEAKGEKLFEGNEWSDRNHRDELMKKIEALFYQYIK